MLTFKTTYMYRNLLKNTFLFQNTYQVYSEQNTFLFSVSNDGITKFWIDEFSGDIVLINPLDFESFQNYIVTYVAADHGNLKVKT